MKIEKVILLLILTIFLSSCGNKGLGMKIKIAEIEVPSKIPKAVTEAKVGKLRIAICGIPINKSQPLTDALAVAFTAKKPPAGDLTFLKLSSRNRTMEHPSRASAEIDATCIWTEPDGETTGFEVTVRTHSISLESKSQLKDLRDLALEGMVRELAKTL